MAQELETSTTLKYASLLTLTVQNTLLIVSMRYSRLVPPEQRYITTTAVVFSEFAKMCVCLLIIFFREKTFKEFVKTLHHHLIEEWKDTLKMSVPAIVYMIQNNLQYVAVSNLEAAVFQVTYQLKILTTALFSVLLLSKKLSGAQWGSLVILFVGVAFVQVQGGGTSKVNTTDQNQIVGLIAVIVSCLSSGFAGVYFEMMLKGSNVSVWMRNVQLGMFGSITAILGVLLKDYDTIQKNGYFVGYSPLVWIVISQQAFGGLIVALVVRYADNILKGFATSLSIILSCIAAVFLFDYFITPFFAIGAVFVMVAIYLYGKPRAQQPTSPLLADKKDQDEQLPIKKLTPT
ncbi:UDP-galactose translocator-like [Halichondria panicea]|uniref:UDP-galactose translocator-like n=1 Tax=Halichondria panicea TaxID=6063 RepID=UPI00312B9C40